MLPLILKRIGIKIFCLCNRSYTENVLVSLIILTRESATIQWMTTLLTIRIVSLSIPEKLSIRKRKKTTTMIILKISKNFALNKRCFKLTLKFSNLSIPNYKIKDKIPIKQNQNL